MFSPVGVGLKEFYCKEESDNKAAHPRKCSHGLYSRLMIYTLVSWPTIAWCEELFCRSYEIPQVS